MPRKSFERVPLPTDADMVNALEKKREIVGFSATNIEQSLFLKLAFHTGDIGVVYLDPIRADYLLRTLQKMLPAREESDGSPVRWAASGLTDQKGFLP